VQRAWVWPSAAPWRWNHWPDEHPPQPPWFRSLRWGERDDRWVSGPSCETVRTAEPRGAEGQAGFQWVYDQPKNDPGHPLLVVTHSMDVVAARNTIGARRWVFVTRRGNTMGRGAGCSSRGAETRWGTAPGVRHAARKHDWGTAPGAWSRGAETRWGAAPGAWSRGASGRTPWSSGATRVGSFVGLARRWEPGYPVRRTLGAGGRAEGSCAHHHHEPANHGQHHEPRGHSGGGRELARSEASGFRWDLVSLADGTVRHLETRARRKAG